MAATATATPGKYLNLDETPVQGQTGWALLDFSGNVLVLSGGNGGGNGDDDDDDGGSRMKANVSILYQMLLETTQILEPEEDFRKLTVSFPSSQYLVSRDEHHIYV